ncbi:envelope stress response membrane protein PspC [Rheinheimera sp. MMS21-TC3]|uniref:envelope stress response membrane protein PspC n=1 Tax=Rheinheimera sp. MMS21-TC3 TaxID=3072790 RepID=UPI0028C3CC99|nr:envelope stress response membrane protein PspC [Rheinheimera sp. MMS21-TC3]WNO61444.1 envelope stress response membrane protein PspC [Rheinheimera sp. MMS21-TC3]
MTKIRGELFRDDANAKIAGVCAGIADYFGWEVWLVRIITLSGLFLGSGLVFMLYIAGWVVLEKKSNAQARQGKDGASSQASFKERQVEIKTRVWQRGEAPKQALSHLNHQFNEIELRLRDIERHVTSRKFQLNKEFNNL